MRHDRIHRIALTIALPLALVACSDSDDSTGNNGGGQQQPASLFDLLTRRGLTTLATAVEAAGLEATLDGAGSFTLFAPTNDAFAALPAGLLQDLLLPANQAALRALIEYHLVVGKTNVATLEGLTSLMSVEGSDLLVDAPGGVVFINDARVGAADVDATNGLLHEVDAVLMPPTTLLSTLDARGFTILRDLIDRAGLAGALTGGNLTLVAPTDAAFNALPPGRLDELRDPMNQAELIDLLTFHVLPGRRSALELLFNGDTQNLNGDLLFACAHGNQFRVNDVPCPRFNLPATDGLLHVASAVLTRTSSARQVLDDQNLATFAGLVDLAGLGPALSSAGAFTLIVPTDAALAALPAGELAFLQDPLNQAERLAFLQRHIVADALQQVEIARLDELTVESGQTFVVESTSGLVIGGVAVTPGDAFATNGIIHQIEAVLPAP